MSEQRQHNLDELMSEIAEVKRLIIQEGALMMQKLQAIQDAQPPEITLYRTEVAEEIEESTLSQIQAFTRRERA